MRMRVEQVFTGHARPESWRRSNRHRNTRHRSGSGGGSGRLAHSLRQLSIFLLRVSSARLGSARLGSARLGSYRTLFSTPHLENVVFARKCHLCLQAGNPHPARPGVFPFPTAPHARVPQGAPGCRRVPQGPRVFSAASTPQATPAAHCAPASRPLNASNHSAEGAPQPAPHAPPPHTSPEMRKLRTRASRHPPFLRDAGGNYSPSY